MLATVMEACVLAGARICRLECDAISFVSEVLEINLSLLYRVRNFRNMVSLNIYSSEPPLVALLISNVEFLFNPLKHGHGESVLEVVLWHECRCLNYLGEVSSVRSSIHYSLVT